MKGNSCFCGSNLSFFDCCYPIIKGLKKAATAESLMRSRYSAYVTHSAGYLLATTHSSRRNQHFVNEILSWATSNQWQHLEIIKTTLYTVEFKAHFLNANQELQVHHEYSRFVFENERWFYVDGDYF